MNSADNLKAPHTGLKILIVDDEPDTVAYLTSLLEDNGYQTVSANNGSEAIDKAKLEKPDLITLDITMPEQSGVKTLTQLQIDSVTEDIPVIIITGVTHTFKRFIHTRKQVKAPAGYIEKPIDQEETLALIREILS